MKFKNLTDEDKKLITKIYYQDRDRSIRVADEFSIHERTSRKWFKKLGLTEDKRTDYRILIYDIETSLVPALVFWSGKQYISSDMITEEPRIITVAWKWLDSSIVHHLTWDENHSDEKLMRGFLKEYNAADMVIGVNNNNFDNRWINARAMKFNLDVNVHIRSLDIQKEWKRLFRTVGYSMKYYAEYNNTTLKESHEGKIMWKKIQFGTKEEQREYLEKMVKYNVGDIVATEELYLKLRKYMNHKIHVGVLLGEEKYTCPNCGGDNIYLYKKTVTPAGTNQYIMKCREDDTVFKISESIYKKFIEK